MRASNSPMPTARISSTRRLSVPRLRCKDGLPCTTTRQPSASGGCRSRTSPTAQVRVIDTSATGSRKVRNAVPVPGLALTWVICPSTQTAPNRSIHPAILRATVRTGQGASAVVVGPVASEGPVPSAGLVTEVSVTVILFFGSGQWRSGSIAG